MGAKAKAKSAVRAAKPAPPRESIAALRGRLRRTEMLIRLSQRVATIDNLDDLLATIVELTANETNAERGTLFLNDPASNELYSRAAQGTFNREIRLLNNSGIAGVVFLFSGARLIHINTRWVWPGVLVGISIAFLLEWRYAKRPAS